MQSNDVNLWYFKLRLFYYYRQTRKIYFDVPFDNACKVPVLQELLNTRMNNLYVEGFDDYVITEMINMLCIE